MLAEAPFEVLIATRLAVSPSPNGFPWLWFALGLLLLLALAALPAAREGRRYWARHHIRAEATQVTTT